MLFDIILKIKNYILTDTKQKYTQTCFNLTGIDLRAHMFVDRLGPLKMSTPTNLNKFVFNFSSNKRLKKNTCCKEAKSRNHTKEISSIICIRIMIILVTYLLFDFL